MVTVTSPVLGRDRSQFGRKQWTSDRIWKRQDHRHLSISSSWRARIKTGRPPRQRHSINMRSGSLTRYYPPAARGQDGDGFTEELIKIAAPVVLESLQSGLRTASSGKFLGVAGDVIEQTLKRGVKRKAGALIKAGVKAGGQHI